jgi:hypothetical protein
MVFRIKWYPIRIDANLCPCQILSLLHAIVAMGTKGSEVGLHECQFRVFLHLLDMVHVLRSAHAIEFKAVLTQWLALQLNAPELQPPLGTVRPRCHESFLLRIPYTWTTTQGHLGVL